MKWRSRLRQIKTLKDRLHGVRYRTPFPDLKVEQRTSPCSNAFANVEGKRKSHKDAKQFPVGNQHKQGLELITPEMVKNDLKYMGGKKT